jgi:nitrate reductase NapAB chaperone NapD
LKPGYGVTEMIRADLETIQEIKDFIARLPDVSVAYQTTTPGKLWIIPKEGRGRK